MDAIDFKIRHEKMIAQVKPPPTKRKIERKPGERSETERDAMKYETVIFPKPLSIGVITPLAVKNAVHFLPVTPFASLRLAHASRWGKILTFIAGGIIQLSAKSNS